MRPMFRSIRRALHEIGEILEDASKMRREARRRYPHVSEE